MFFRPYRLRTVFWTYSLVISGLQLVIFVSLGNFSLSVLVAVTSLAIPDLTTSYIPSWAWTVVVCLMFVCFAIALALCLPEVVDQYHFSILERMVVSHLVVECAERGAVAPAFAAGFEKTVRRLQDFIFWRWMQWIIQVLRRRLWGERTPLSEQFHDDFTFVMNSREAFSLRVQLDQAGASDGAAVMETVFLEASILLETYLVLRNICDLRTKNWAQNLSSDPFVSFINNKTSFRSSPVPMRYGDSSILARLSDRKLSAAGIPPENRALARVMLLQGLAVHSRQKQFAFRWTLQFLDGNFGSQRAGGPAPGLDLHLQRTTRPQDLPPLSIQRESPESFPSLSFPDRAEASPIQPETPASTRPLIRLHFGAEATARRKHQIPKFQI